MQVLFIKDVQVIIDKITYLLVDERINAFTDMLVPCNGPDSVDLFVNGIAANIYGKQINIFLAGMLLINIKIGMTEDCWYSKIIAILYIPLSYHDDLSVFNLCYM